jgi:multiple sugar transport system substrate-binding protein
MKMRTLSLLVLLLTVALLSFSLGQAQDNQELVIWAEGALVNSIETEGSFGWTLVHGFEESHPGVTVRIEYHGWDEELRQNLLTAFLAGAAPDIVVGEAYFQQYADLGALVPVDDIVAENADNLIPGTYAGAAVGDSVYGISGFTGVFGFERNCAVVEAAGLDCDTPPATWDELLTQAQQITEAGGGETYGYTLQGPVGFSIGAVFRAYVLLAQSGASLCSNDCTEPYFNDPNAVPVYEFIRELHRTTPPGLSFNTDEGQVYMQLFQGVSAYQIAGSWHPGWAQENGCEDCRYSAVPIPDGGEPASVVVGNVIFAILSQSDQQELAKEWIRYLVTDEVQNLVYPTIGRLPSTRSALEALAADPDVEESTKSFIDILLNSENLLVLPQWRSNPQLVWTAWNDMFTRVLTTEDPIQQILDEGQAAALAAAG